MCGRFCGCPTAIRTHSWSTVKDPAWNYRAVTLRCRLLLEHQGRLTVKPLPPVKPSVDVKETLVPSDSKDVKIAARVAHDSETELEVDIAKSGSWRNCERVGRRESHTTVAAGMSTRYLTARRKTVRAAMNH